MPVPFAPIAHPMLNHSQELVTSPWALFFQNIQQAVPSGGSAPADADYVLTAADADLPNGRVATTSTTVAVNTATSGQIKWDLRDTAVTPGTYGDATHVSRVTVDQQGRVTAASNVAITATGTVTTTGSPVSGNLTKFSGPTSITNGDLSGDVSTSGTLVSTLANTAVAAGSYGDGTHVGAFTVDAKGRLTAASSVAITATGTVTHTAGALTANELVVGNGGADIKVVAATDGQVPIGKSSDGSVTLATLTAGAGITITNAAASVTIAATSTGGGTVIGVDRLLGDGSTTAFNLADIAEYVTCVSDAGLVVDPSIYSLSSTRDQVIFATAPTAAHVLTFQYVEATL